MNEMRTYRDKLTGVAITQYTAGPMRNAKLYFTTENFTVDDRYFFFNRENDGLYRCEVETGELRKMADAAQYSGFAMDRWGNWGVMSRRDGAVCRLDCGSGEITELGFLPAGGHITGHLTTANTGRVACSYQLSNMIFALVILDPGRKDGEIVHMSDYHLGHAQICPSDENLIFYIHETGGDALQRTWMYDIAARASRPYYVEKWGDWITHEVWSADGEEMALMRMPDVWTGDKDGHVFRMEAHSRRTMHHPCLSRDRRFICADTFALNLKHVDGKGVVRDESVEELGPAVVLFDRQTGRETEIAVTNVPKTGDDHLHPSFNRKGDKILFSDPDDNGVAQVCVADISGII